jgi:sarcosine oxidase
LNRRSDVIVAGLGPFGSAAARALTRRGVGVLGLDRHQPPHELASHGGRTRIVREAYFEAPLYVPLVRAAFDGWNALGEDAGRRLFQRTGGLMIGPADGELIQGTLASVREHGIAHELLGAVDLRARFPRLEVRDAAVGVLEERAGVLDGPGCVEALLASAGDAGARLRFGEPVEGWTASPDGVEVTTPSGRYQADALVLATGPWMSRMLTGEGLPRLRVERQVVHWFEPVEAPETFRAPDFPVTVWEHVPGRFFYTIPDLGEGVKAALHRGGQVTDPEQVRREVTDGDRDAIRHLVGRFLPTLAGTIADSSVCLYTNTPDGHFLLGRHPREPRVILAGGGSGHGFKFAPVIGELVADLATGEAPPFDLSPLDPGRFDD